MKTPREILLARHQAVEPELNRIRRQAVRVAADVNRRNAPAREFTFAATAARTLATMYRELIWPARRTWAALAAVWLMLLSVNFAMREPSPTREARNTSSESAQFETMFRLREQMLAQLAGPVEKPQFVRPKAATPQPRSQRRQEFMNA
jgi:hypothetical protein